MYTTKQRDRYLNVPSLKWRIEHEKVALEEFNMLMSERYFEIEECGLNLLFDSPYISASADIYLSIP